MYPRNAWGDKGGKWEPGVHEGKKAGNGAGGS